MCHYISNEEKKVRESPYNAAGDSEVGRISLSCGEYTCFSNYRTFF